MKFKSSGSRLTFKCPGCEYTHSVPIDGSRGWKFNEAEVTLTPSIKETRGHYVQGQPQPPDCPMCDSDIIGTNGKKFYNCGCCHLILTKGMIYFCLDSTHALAGKTVPMIELQPEGT